MSFTCNVLFSDVKVPKRQFLAATLLISGTLAWFFMLNLRLYDVYGVVAQNEPIWMYYNVGQVLFYGFAVLSGILGGLYARRIDRFQLLVLWITLGILSTLSLVAFQGSPLIAISSALLGVSLGFGLPSCLAFMAECTAIEERGRVSGIIILSTFILGFIVLALMGVLGLDITQSILLFAALRGISFVALVFDTCEDKARKHMAPAPLPSIAYKEYLFYLLPWVLFCVAAGLASNVFPQTSDYASAVKFGGSLRYIFIAASSVIAGFLADWIGRKQPVIFGLIILGISFALLGFAMSPITVILYFAASGLAWGSFFAIFIAIPADLSVQGSREKFYGLGYILPLAILFGLGAIPGVATFSSFSASSFSLILSVILFIALVPLLRAKETLPERKIDERKMKEYLQKVGEVVHEYSRDEGSKKD